MWLFNNKNKINYDLNVYTKFIGTKKVLKAHQLYKLINKDKNDFYIKDIKLMTNLIECKWIMVNQSTNDKYIITTYKKEYIEELLNDDNISMELKEFIKKIKIKNKYLVSFVKE